MDLIRLKTTAMCLARGGTMVCMATPQESHLIAFVTFVSRYERVGR